MAWASDKRGGEVAADALPPGARAFVTVQEVGDRLKANQPVILNLQAIAAELRRRLVDFSSGLAYATGGTMARVADRVYLLTPSNVEISQEEKERLQARGLFQT